MTASLDLTILPIVKSVKPEQPSLPGLHVASPPRRTARGRNRDHLLLYLSFSGNAPLGTEQTYELLSKLAQTFYKTSSSVTTAQRVVAESLNEFLLNRNLRSASSGQQVIGFFTQAVLRESSIHVAQSGPVHTFIIVSGTAQHLYDPQLSGRGLGLSRTTTVRFSQADLKPNDAILIVPHLPTSWTSEAIITAHMQGPESLRRRLLGEIGPNMSAALIQALPGDGQIRMLRPVKIQKPAPPKKEDHPAPTLTEEHGSTPPAGVAESAAPPETLLSQTPQGTTPRAAVRPAQTVTRAQRSTVEDQKPPPVKVAAPTTAPKKPSEAKRAIAAGILQFFNWLSNLGKQLLPDESIFTIPPGTMALIAIIVPIVVVILASMVYFQRGRAAQHDIYFLQSVEQAQYAETLTIPHEQRLAWETTLVHLDQAELYQSTTDSEALRAKAQNHIDKLNVIERLNFQPALTRALKDNTRITRMISIDNDLYLLNAEEGIVVRATLSSRGYIEDQIFQCGPGPYEGYIVGALIDIAPLTTADDSNATILGIDASGNLLYCGPGVPPKAGALTPDPLVWGTPIRITINMNDLYVLDPQANAIWIYRGLDVSKQPQRFFSGQNPSIDHAIDLAVNNDTLYVLHADSHITTCEYSTLVGSPSRCEDPATFSEPRVGLESGPLVYGAQFNEILFLPPPDPSIYLLDPFAKSVYHFSVQLAFQRQFQSRTSLPNDPATSFTINRANLTIFIATGNQVYYANLP